MAKRFITTSIFKDAWFMDLPNKYKLFWLFLITDCDHAGIWQVNYKNAAFYVGEHLEPGECERIMKDRFVKIENGKYWFIPKFVEFQYGLVLKTSNKALEKVIGSIDMYNLMPYLPKITIERSGGQGATKGLSSSMLGDKEEEEDKEKEKELKKEKDKMKKPCKRDQITKYFLDKEYPLEEAESFFNHYEAQGWVTGNGIPIVNWRSKAENWHKEQQLRFLDKKNNNLGINTPAAHKLL